MKSCQPASLILGALILCSAARAEDSTNGKEKQGGTTPTRLIAGDVEAHLVGLRSRLAINGKERGPFGLFQEPGKEPKQPILTPSKRPEKQAEIPFAAVINALRISTVIPDEKKFMVGARLLRVGQSLPLKVGGKTIRVEVVSVRIDEIVFRNLATNEEAVKRLDLLPEGVGRGSGSIVVPGMTPIGGRGEEAPLEMDLGLPPEPPEE